MLDYLYFKEYCKVIAIDLSKQLALDADSKAIQQIIFIGNLDQQATICFIIVEAKKNYFGFFTRNCDGYLI